MNVGVTPPLKNAEASLATRAAWLHYAGRMTQADVARRLGVSSLKAHRLITRAYQNGLVKVFIDGAVCECIELENAIGLRHGLDYCEVIPEFDYDELPLRALGHAGAQFLKREIEIGKDTLIGIGHGRTLAASVEFLPKISGLNTRFVSLLGGLTRKLSANPHDVIHRLAERTGSEAYVMPVPFFANTVEDRDVLMAQRGISQVLDLARSAGLLFVGIGTAEPAASLVETGMIEPQEINEVKAMGGVGELLGHFFNSRGEAVDTLLTERTLALSLDALRDRRIIAIAGGQMKIPAINSVLESRLLRGLITDERTARALVESEAS